MDAQSEHSLISSINQHAAAIVAQLNPVFAKKPHTVSIVEPNCLVQSVCEANAHSQGNIGGQMHDPVFQGDSIVVHVEEEEGLDFLTGVLANKKLCQELGVGQGNVDRTMLACEGLAVNFLYDYGRSSNMVCLQSLFPETYSNHVTSVYTFFYNEYALHADCSGAAVVLIHASNRRHHTQQLPLQDHPIIEECTIMGKR